MSNMRENQIKPRSLQASRRGSKTRHIVTNVGRWYGGMTLTTECGVQFAEVLDVPAERNDATLCKRCRHTLGWDL